MNNQTHSGEVHYKFVGQETGTYEYAGSSWDDVLEQFRFEMSLHDLMVRWYEADNQLKLWHPTIEHPTLIDTLTIEKLDA